MITIVPTPGQTPTGKCSYCGAQPQSLDDEFALAVIGKDDEPTEMCGTCALAFLDGQMNADRAITYFIQMTDGRWIDTDMNDPADVRIDYEERNAT